MPEEARRVIEAFESALDQRDYDAAQRHIDFRYRLAETLGELWRGGPERARADLEARLEEMFVTTSESLRERFVGRTRRLAVMRRDGAHLWVTSEVVRNAPHGQGFAWQYRLTPRGTSWAITQREYLVSGMPSDSTRFWPMALKQIGLKYGRIPTLSELAANLPAVMGTMRIRRYRVP